MVVKKLSGNNGSFPSGHTSSSFATATAIQQRWGWKAGFPAYLLASYAGITRLHQNHYLGDVAFGLERQFAKKVAAITTREDGVGARMRAGLRASNRRARHLPMRSETGLPSSVIRFRTLHASTASRRCPDELRARRQSPTIDVYRKNAFSTRAC